MNWDQKPMLVCLACLLRACGKACNATCIEEGRCPSLKGPGLEVFHIRLSDHADYAFVETGYLPNIRGSPSSYIRLQSTNCKGSTLKINRGDSHQSDPRNEVHFHIKKQVVDWRSPPQPHPVQQGR